MDTSLVNLASKNDSVSTEEFFGSWAHSETGINLYLGLNCARFLDHMPISFVGRVEYMVEDWDDFLAQRLGLGENERREKQVAKIAWSLLEDGFTTQTKLKFELPHTHQVPTAGQRLSHEAVSYIRAYFAADYTCLDEMVIRGLLPREYPTELLSREIYEY